MRADRNLAAPRLASRTCPKQRSCPQCQASFQTYRGETVYCSRKCKTDAANLEASRGKALYRLAYNWRTAQRAKAGAPAKGKGAAFSDLSYLVDRFIAEDREAGRPAPPAGPRDMTVAQSYNTRHRAARQAVQRRSQA